MTYWTGSQLVQPVDKISEILTVDFPKNKESKKKKQWSSIPSLDERELVKTR